MRGDINGRKGKKRVKNYDIYISRKQSTERERDLRFPLPDKFILPLWK